MPTRSDPLPSWQGCAQWRILDTAFGRGTDFLSAWQAWRDDAARPGLLHWVAIDAFPPDAAGLLAAAAPAHRELARTLAAQWWGLLPGLHRLSLEQGRVLLTLCVGPPGDMLRELAFGADLIRVDLAALQEDSAARRLARLCRRGTRLEFRDPVDTQRSATLRACGIHAEPGSASGRYDPAWQPRHAVDAPEPASVAVVIGAGLAGAAAAASLARRGWQVQVLDQAQAPAAGASALPAGLMAPHLSPDDNLLSRLSRCGARITWQEASRLLRPGEDWAGSGVLEHRLRPGARAVDSAGFAADWTRAPDPEQRNEAMLPEDAPAAWHPHAGWIRPAALVAAWLDTPGVDFRGGIAVARLARSGERWQVLDDAGAVRAEAPLVVVAAAFASSQLLHGRLALHPVRGQVSWAAHQPGQRLPTVPINGNGHFIPDVPIGSGPRAWICGSTYGRAEVATDLREADHLANAQRLRELAPALGHELALDFAVGRVQGWAGVRCASTDRRPLVGEVEPGLWVSTAMGSRGLTFAALCGEVLAAGVHREPSPLPLSLQAAVDVGRQLRA